LFPVECAISVRLSESVCHKYAQYEKVASKSNNKIAKATATTQRVCVCVCVVSVSVQRKSARVLVFSGGGVRFARPVSIN